MQPKGSSQPWLASRGHTSPAVVPGHDLAVTKGLRTPTKALRVLLLDPLDFSMKSNVSMSHDSQTPRAAPPPPWKPPATPAMPRRPPGVLCPSDPSRNRGFQTLKSGPGADEGPLLVERGHAEPTQSSIRHPGSPGGAREAGFCPSKISRLKSGGLGPSSPRRAPPTVCFSGRGFQGVPTATLMTASLRSPSSHTSYP